MSSTPSPANWSLKASTSLDTIAQAVAQISEISRQISTVTHHSHTMATEIHSHSSAIGEVAENSTDTARRLSLQSATLFEQSSHLRTMLARYKV